MVIGDEAVALIRNPDNSRPEPSLMLGTPIQRAVPSMPKEDCVAPAPS